MNAVPGGQVVDTLLAATLRVRQLFARKLPKIVALLLRLVVFYHF